MSTYQVQERSAEKVGHVNELFGATKEASEEEPDAAGHGGQAVGSIRYAEFSSFVILILLMASVRGPRMEGVDGGCGDSQQNSQG